MKSLFEFRRPISVLKRSSHACSGDENNVKPVKFRQKPYRNFIALWLNVPAVWSAVKSQSGDFVARTPKPTGVLEHAGLRQRFGARDGVAVFLWMIWMTRSGFTKWHKGSLPFRGCLGVYCFRETVILKKTVPGRKVCFEVSDNSILEIPGEPVGVLNSLNLHREDGNDCQFIRSSDCCHSMFRFSVLVSRKYWMDNSGFVVDTTTEKRFGLNSGRIALKPNVYSKRFGTPSASGSPPGRRSPESVRGSGKNAWIQSAKRVCRVKSNEPGVPPGMPSVVHWVGSLKSESRFGAIRVNENPCPSAASGHGDLSSYRKEKSSALF